MPIDAIVRVSFQANVNANQAANQALVGHVQNANGPGPFARVGTALYAVRDGADNVVGNSLADLGMALSQFSAHIDFVSISMYRHD